MGRSVALQLAVASCVIACVGGCTSKTPTAPTANADLSGSWQGSITDPVAGSAQISLTLRQTNVTTGLVTLAGSWQASFAPAVRTTSGVVTGFQGTTAEQWLIYLDPLGFPPCFERPFPYSTHGQGFELHVTRSGDRLVGISTYRTCTETFEGSIELTR